MRILTLTGLVWLTVMATSNRTLAQVPPSSLIYQLQPGSELIDECLVCGRPNIPVPIDGTFRLRLTGQNPLFASYQLQDIFFYTSSTSGPSYQVVGSGTYQVGGEKVVLQNSLLTVHINDGFTNILSYCTNSDQTLKAVWPQLQLSLDQTNGTMIKTYHLDLVAAPALQFLSIIPDAKTGNVTLTWTGPGGQVQLERATSVAGPYSPVTLTTTNQTFVDVGVLTNQVQGFYRLRQY